MRGIVLGIVPLVAALFARPVAAQLELGRSLAVSPVPDTASVGDSVRLRFRLVLNERDLLTDTVPRPISELPAGVRVYSVEKLRRGADRIFTGEAVVAFYRPGEREIPVFGVPWVQIVTGQRGVLASEAASVMIAPIIPGGNPTLRDIREPEPSPWPGWWWLLLVPVGLAGWLLLRRRRSVGPPVAVPVPGAPPVPLDPYHVALARLAEIEREEWAARGAVERHYEAAVDTLREYLESAEDVPARERTSTELLWALPPRLMDGGLRRLTAQVFAEADLVKFARVRPEPIAATSHLHEARDLLRRWHEAGTGEPNAVR
jgi:hypothetical protein